MRAQRMSFVIVFVCYLSTLKSLGWGWAATQVIEQWVTQLLLQKQGCEGPLRVKAWLLGICLQAVMCATLHVVPVLSLPLSSCF
jgi:hypothetical protein